MTAPTSPKDVAWSLLDIGCAVLAGVLHLFLGERADRREAAFKAARPRMHTMWCPKCERKYQLPYIGPCKHGVK